MAAPYYPYGAPPPPQMPAAPMPVAVVSPQFCAPYAVPMTVTKKAVSLSGGDFVVTDANGAEMLRVKGAFFSMHDRRVLRDAAGQPLVSMRGKVLSMHNRWEVYRGDSTNASDLLFTVKKTAVFQLRTEITRKYTAANLLLGKDTFVVTVFPHVDYVFIAALVVILDEMHRERFDWDF
nr:unnamed protein product [Digitaria exilis]CAB3503293.1 unnamed protein product [Digitaria exilis]